MNEMTTASSKSSAECSVLSAEEQAIESVRTISTPHAALSTQHLIALPELPITVRLGTIQDIPFIDELQKKQTKNLGFMHRGTLEGKIKLGEVLIAEEVVSSEWPVVSEDTGGVPSVAPKSGLTTHYSPLTTSKRVGYLIGNDRYFKRDELGAIFQLCVVPNKQRGLIGATLLKALFERASYGCKLYCCWCAKDLDANHFWEAMGFVPIAFRSGSKKKVKGPDGKLGPRVHIFWQKRIRSGDDSTPWWFPSQTGGGAIGEDRIVLPIPPGVHWSEVESVVLPGSEVGGQQSTVGADALHSLPTADCRPPTDPQTKTKRVRKSKSDPQSTIHSPQSKKKEPYTLRPSAMIYFDVPKPVLDSKAAPKSKREKPKKVKQKNDPKLVAAARELRDRYLEEVNRNPHLFSNAKYDVARLVDETASSGIGIEMKSTKRLAA